MLPSPRWAMWASRARLHLDLLVSIQICAQSPVLYWLAASGFFFQDDFLNLQQAANSPLDLHYLMTPIFVHLQPGVRFEYWLIDRVIGLQYNVVLAILVALIAATSWTIFVTLRRLLPPTLALPVVIMFTGLWPGWVGAVPWLAASLAVVPSLFACSLTVYAFVRFLQSNELRWTVLTALFFAAGLCFYEGTMVTLPLLILVLAAWVVEAQSGKDWSTHCRRAAVPIFWCAVAATSFIAVDFAKGGVSVGATPSPTQFLEFLGNAWFRAFVPSLAGGPLTWTYVGPRAGGSAQLWLIFVSSTALLALAAYSVCRNGSKALIGWAMIGLPFLALMGLIGWARIVEFGTALGQDYRYEATLIVPASLGLAFALMGRRSQRHFSRFDKQIATGLTLAFTAAFLLGFAYSDPPVGLQWSRAPARAYVARLISGVRSVESAHPGKDWSIYDTEVPASILFSSEWPYTSVIRVTRLWHLNVPSMTSSPQMYAVRSDGSVVHATFRDEDRLPGACVRAGGTLTRTNVALPRGGAWIVRLVGARTGRGRVSLAVATRFGGAVSRPLASATVPGYARRSLFVIYWPVAFRELSLHWSGTRPLCFSGIEIGSPSALPRP